MIKLLKPQSFRGAIQGGRPNVRESLWSCFRNEDAGNDCISSLYRQNLYWEALEAFDFMQKNTSFRIKSSTYAHLICACASLRSLEQGRRVHNDILRSNVQPDIVLHNHILNMYGKCGSLVDARRVFDVMPQRNVVSYTSVIAGYSQNGQEGDAVKLYFEMLQSGVVPDQFTFGSIVKSCSGLGDVGLGRQVHSHVLKSELGSHLIAQNALIAMYTKFDQISDAWNVFSRIPEKDLVSWGSIISGFSKLGYETEALSHFKEMLFQGAYQPNEFIFGSAFSACGSLLQPEYGRQIHGMCIKVGLGRDIFAGCSVCDMYARCGFLDSARTVFYQIERPDLASWNAIIAGLANGGHATEAISYFSKLRHMRIIPDDVTVRSLLCAFTSSLSLSQGMQVHSYIVQLGFESWTTVCNALLTMYAKCSNLHNALTVFEEMGDNVNSVSWNAILTACMQQNQAAETLRLLKLMFVSHSTIDQITMTTVLGACAEVASLEMGNQMHCFTIKSGLLLDVPVMNALIDMYAKCGSLVMSRKLFDSMETPDVVSWSSLIVGYAQFGYDEEALKLFRTMRSSGVNPNQVTFLGVLTACSHVGRVEEGWHFYRTMETEYGIVPTQEHCSSVVDMLARAGRLNEALDFINQMKFYPDIVVWKTLLAACKTHGNVDIGKQAAENILKMDPSNSAAHILLCNIYASSENWGDVANLRSLMRQKGVRKTPGQSWIEVKSNVHVFLAEDVLHPERDKIYRILEELWLQMLDDGYVPSRNRLCGEPG
ncbi:hypothetical protein SLE2022_102530 [Rubroshorea leprosula]